MTIPVPQVGKAEEALLVWQLAEDSTPVQHLHGHKDVVLDFAWAPGLVLSEVRLFSIGKDHVLHSWNLPWHIVEVYFLAPHPTLNFQKMNVFRLSRERNLKMLFEIW